VSEPAEPEAPGWLSGSYTDLQKHSARVWEVTASNAPIRMEKAPSQSRLVVNSRPNAQVVVEGDDNEGACTVEVVCGGRESVRVSTNVASVTLRGPDGADLHASLSDDTVNVIVHAGNWRLDRPTNNRNTAPSLAIDVASAAPVTLQSARPSHYLKAAGDLEAAVSLSADAIVEVAGNLKVNDRPVQAGAAFRVGGALTLAKAVGQCTIDAAALTAVSIEGGGERRAEVRVAGAAKFEKGLNKTDLTAQSLEVGGQIQDCTVESSGPVRIAHGLARSTVHVETDADLALVVGTPPRTPAPATVKLTELVPHAMPDTVDEPGGWQSVGNAQVTGSEIRVVGPGLTLLAACHETSAHLDGQLQVAKSLTVSSEQQLRADSIWCTSATLDMTAGAALKAGALVVRDKLELEGPLTDVATLVARGGITTGAAEDANGALRIDCDQLWAARPLPSGSIETRQLLHADGPADVPLQLRAAGVVVLSGGTTVQLEALVDEVLEAHLSAVPVTLDVPSGSHVSVTLDEAPAAVEGDVAGKLHVSARSIADPRVVTGQDRDDGSIDVEASIKQAGSRNNEPAVLAKLVVMPGAELSLSRNTKIGGELVVKSSEQGAKRCVDLVADGGWPVRFDHRAGQTGPIHLNVGGDVRLTLTGSLASMRLSERQDVPPTLTLQGEMSAVDEAAGVFRMGAPFEGRLHGPIRSGEEVLCLVGVAASESAHDSGRLIDVDLTRVPFDEIDNLRSLQVVEPTATSLRQLAGPMHLTGTARRAELRTRAELITRLLSIMDGQAVSGSSRAAAKWTAARLHHKALPARRIEWWLRLLHRGVGYTQHPGHAFVTLLIAIAAAVGARAVAWSIRGVPLTTSNLLDALGTAIVQPFILVRFTDRAEPLFFSPYYNLLAFALVAVPFLFFIIAIRNYLKTPGE